MTVHYRSHFSLVVCVQESYQDTPFQYKCIHKLILCYKWLFDVEEDEDKKEEVQDIVIQA